MTSYKLKAIKKFETQRKHLKIDARIGLEKEKLKNINIFNGQYCFLTQSVWPKLKASIMLFAPPKLLHQNLSIRNVQPN